MNEFEILIFKNFKIIFSMRVLFIFFKWVYFSKKKSTFGMILVERKRANPPNVTRALTQSGGFVS